MVNPHLRGVPRNTVYGSNSVMEMVESGDTMSFYSWPDASFINQRYGGPTFPPLAVTATERIHDPSVLAQASALAAELGSCHTNPVFCTNSTVPWDATDIWRVTFAGHLPAGVD